MKWKKSERNDLEEEYPFWRHGGTLCLNRKWIKIGPTRTVANGEEKEIATRRRISRKHETKTNEKARETKLCLYAFLVIIFSDDLLSFIDIFLNASRFSHTTLLVREAVKAAAAALFHPTIFREKDFDFWSRGRRGRWSIRNKCTRAQPASCPSIVELRRPIQLRNVFMIYPFVSVFSLSVTARSTKK